MYVYVYGYEYVYGVCVYDIYTYMLWYRFYHIISVVVSSCDFNFSTTKFVFEQTTKSITYLFLR